MRTLLQNRYFLWTIAGLFLFNLLVMNGSVMLWDEDEAAYAGFAANMLQSGDWLIPQFEWSDIHRKPPLHFWTIALSYKIFGINEFATRLPSVLAILSTVFVVFFIGKKVFGRDVALTASIVLMASLFIPNIAKIAVVDSSLLFCETLAVLSLLVYLRSPEWKWNLLFWLSIATGLLLKGPPILILTGGLWVFLFIFHPQRKRLIGTHPWIFLPLALLPLLLWGYLVWLRDPEYIQWILDWYIFKRVGGSVMGQSGPPGYYLLIIVLSFLVFLPVLPAAFWDFFKRLRQRDEITLMLAGWLIFGWWFYELLPSKLPAYAIAALPAVAILISRQLLEIDKKDYAYQKLTSIFSVIFVLLFFLVAVSLIYAAFILIGREAAVRVIFLMFLLWPLSFISGTLMFAKRYVYGIGGLILTGVLFTTFAWMILMPHIEPHRNAPLRLAQQTATIAPDGATIILGDDFSELPSIPFYLSRYFNNYYHEKDLSKAIERLRTSEPHVVIAGDEWKEKIISNLTATSDSLSTQIHLTGRATDRLEVGSYWILMR